MDTATSETALLASHQRKFITGSHILHHQGVLDAYGHLSYRHPLNPAVFVMSRSIAPGTIASPDDLIEYHVADAEPVDSTTTKKGYAERHIHSEVYKRHAAVHAVVHSHAESVVPYTIAGVPLRPCYHMAGFLGLGTGAPPVYDAAEHYVDKDDDVADLLVRNTRLGAPLAACFDDGSVVALMRGHGLTVVGGAVEEVVARAVYTMKNASIQTAAMALQAAAFGVGEGEGKGLRFLSAEEAEAATLMAKWSAQRPWKLWEREVEACGLYRNSA